MLKDFCDFASQVQKEIGDDAEVEVCVTAEDMSINVYWPSIDYELSRCFSGYVLTIINEPPVMRVLVEHAKQKKEAYDQAVIKAYLAGKGAVPKVGSSTAGAPEPNKPKIIIPIVTTTIPKRLALSMVIYRKSFSNVSFFSPRRAIEYILVNPENIISVEMLKALGSKN